MPQFSPPVIGPSTYFEQETGESYPALIWLVGDHSPDNRYWNVGVAWATQEDGQSRLMTGFNVYDAKQKRVESTPPGPPWA